MQTFFSSIKIKLSVSLSKLCLISKNSSKGSQRCSYSMWNWWSCRIAIISSPISPIHFLFQIDECVVPVQRNKTFVDYVSEYNWYIINWALILNQKSDINDEFTHYMFILNIKWCDEVQNSNIHNMTTLQNDTRQKTSWIQLLNYGSVFQPHQLLVVDLFEIKIKRMFIVWYNCTVWWW